MPKTITKKSSTPFRYTAIGLCLVVLHMLDVQVVHDKSYELLVCWTCFTAVNRIMKDAHNLIHITAQPCDFNGNTNRTLHTLNRCMMTLCDECVYIIDDMV